MSEQTTARTPVPVATDAADRGRLDVRTKALQHIIERLALTVPGSVTHESVMDKVRGAGEPHASVTMEGRSARVHVDVAAVWPARVTELAAGVREVVLREAPRIAGINIRSCDVIVRAITPAEADNPPRRVQ